MSSFAKSHMHRTLLSHRDGFTLGVPYDFTKVPSLLSDREGNTLSVPYDFIKVPYDHEQSCVDCIDCALYKVAFPDMDATKGCKQLLWLKKIARCKKTIERVQKESCVSKTMKKEYGAKTSVS